MTRYALIDDGRVLTVVTEAVEGIELPDDSPVGTGWTYDGEFHPPAVTVPHEVAMWQARTVMAVTPFGTGSLLEVVDAAVASVGPIAKVQWEYAPNIRRDSMLVSQLAPALGLSDEMVDQLFINAAQVR